MRRLLHTLIKPQKEALLSVLQSLNAFQFKAYIIIFHTFPAFSYFFILFNIHSHSQLLADYFSFLENVVLHETGSKSFFLKVI